MPISHISQSIISKICIYINDKKKVPTTLYFKRRIPPPPSESPVMDFQNSKVTILTYFQLFPPILMHDAMMNVVKL